MSFIPFITCGDPSLDVTEQLVYKMEKVGADLIELGMKPGPDMGRILKELLNRVLDAPELNTREQLLAIVKESYL